MPTIEYLISVQHQLYWKTPFHMACKEGQFDVVVRIANNQFEAFSINLIARHVNGMTLFYWKIYGYQVL